MRCLTSTASPGSGINLVAPPNDSLMGFQASGGNGKDERATPCDLLRSPKPSRVSRFLSHFRAGPHVLPKNSATVTNPTRGAFFARCSTGSHRAARSSIDHALPSASSGNKCSSIAELLLAKTGRRTVNATPP